MRMLVCDDFPGQANQTREAIRKGWTAAGFADDDLDIVIAAGKDPKTNKIEGYVDLKDELNKLFSNVRNTSEGKKARNLKTIFDDKDIVFIDNNLSHLNFDGAVHTAETLSGYVRAFTTCNYIVSLNRNDYDFDLKDLIGDPRTLADLSVKVAHLSIPGLWRRDKTPLNPFRPWYWPELITAPLRRASQIKKVKRSLDKSILKTLQFPSRVIDRLSRKALAGLSGEIGLDAKEAINVSFQNYFERSAKSLPIREKSLAEDSELVSRVVSAEIEAWLRREILAPQEMLVDIPHLLLRMPFLLGKNGASLEAWNYALSSAAQPFGLDADIFSEYFQSKGRIFKATEWLDVTAFWWPTINSDDALSQMFFEASDAINPVFLEDRSLFAANTSDQIREFAAGVDGQWARRHVAGLSKMIYAPRSMFAM